MNCARFATALQTPISYCKMTKPITDKPALSLDRQLIVIITAGLIGLLLIWLARYALLAFLPIIMSMMISFSLNPAVARLEARLIPHTTAVVLVIAALSVIFVMLGFYWIPSLNVDFHALADAFGQDELSNASAMSGKTPDWFTPLNPLINIALSFLTFLFKQSSNILPQSSILILAAIFTLPLAFFLLRDGENLKKSILRRTPNRLLELTIHATDDIENQIRRLSGELFTISAY